MFYLLDELRTVDLVELTACSIFDDFQVDIEAFAVDVICSKIRSQDLMKVQEYLHFEESTRSFDFESCETRKTVN